MKKFSLLLLAITLVFLASNVPSGAEWVNMGKDGGENEYWYDRETVKELQTGIIELWIKTAYSDKGREIKIQSMMRDGLDTKGYETLNDTKALLEINCVAEERRILKVNHYSNGILIPGGSWSVTLKPLEGWEPILPGRIGTALLKGACAPIKNRDK